MRVINNVRQTARAVKATSMLIKAISVTLACMLALFAMTYFASYFYDKFSSFSVSVEEYDMVKQGLSLSRTPEFTDPTSRLKTDSVSDCTNISGDSLPDNIDMINGDHNGSDYIATTYYLKNVGQDTVTVDYALTISNVTNGVDEAIRFKIYVNGESAVYAKTKNDGSGAESGTTEFLTLSTVTEKRIYAIAPGDIIKFTVVMWIEGDDPECTDKIIGGKIKADMEIKIVEGA